MRIHIARIQNIADKWERAKKIIRQTRLKICQKLVRNRLDLMENMAFGFLKINENSIDFDSIKLIFFTN